MVHSSRLRLAIDASVVLTLSQVKVKCLVTVFRVYHRSNEVSLEVFKVKEKTKEKEMSGKTYSWQDLFREGYAAEARELDRHRKTSSARATNCQICLLTLSLSLSLLVVVFLN